MVNVLADLTLANGWACALAGKADWDEMFDGFNSAVDYPTAFFHRELLAAYPDAKVVLSVREGRAWARSMHDTIWACRHISSWSGPRLTAGDRCASSWNGRYRLLRCHA